MESPPSNLFETEIDKITWEEKIKAELIQLYGTDKKDLESLVRIFIFLTMDENRDTTPSAWLTLANVLQSSMPKSYFKIVVDAMVEDTKNDVLMNETYEEVMLNMAEESGCEVAAASGQLVVRSKDMTDAEDLDFEVISTTDIVAFGVQTLLRSIIPLNLIRQVFSNRQALLSIDEFVNLVNKSTGSIIMVGLAALHVGVVVIQQLCDWWNGSITGVRCIKTIIDSTVTVTAGVLGGMAGGAVGASCVGPIGALVGGIIGGIWTSERAHAFFEKMTQKIFGVPKSSALENAYNFFNVNMDSPNEEINKIFRIKCLEHHPDKGGNSEDFIEVQLHMGVIKMARGDMTSAPSTTS